MSAKPDLSSVSKGTQVRDSEGFTFAEVAVVLEDGILITTGRFHTQDIFVSSQWIAGYVADEGYMQLSITEHEVYARVEFGREQKADC